MAKQTKIEWADTFWSKVKKTDTCWIWQAGCFTNGYGQFRAGNKKVKAHRFAYELNNGPVPIGSVLLHTCDNRKCVNPEHLVPGTQKDNVHDCMRKGRRVIGHHDHHGMKNPAAVINQEVATAIRSERKNGLTYKMISEKYGVCKSQVANIIKNRSWR